MKVMCSMTQYSQGFDGSLERSNGSDDKNFNVWNKFCEPFIFEMTEKPKARMNIWTSPVATGSFGGLGLPKQNPKPPKSKYETL